MMIAGKGEGNMKGTNKGYNTGFIYTPMKAKPGAPNPFGIDRELEELAPEQQKGEWKGKGKGNGKGKGKGKSESEHESESSSHGGKGSDD
jgi:hypothetical protein